MLGKGLISAGPPQTTAATSTAGTTRVASKSRAVIFMGMWRRLQKGVLNHAKGACACVLCALCVRGKEAFEHVLKRGKTFKVERGMPRLLRRSAQLASALRRSDTWAARKALALRGLQCRCVRRGRDNPVFVLSAGRAYAWTLF